MALKRHFFMKLADGSDLELPDIDVGMSAVDIKDVYAAEYPQLVNAKIIYHEPNEKGDVNYGFEPAETAGKNSPATGRDAQSTKGSVEFKPSIGKKG